MTGLMFEKAPHYTRLLCGLVSPMKYCHPCLRWNTWPHTSNLLDNACLRLLKNFVTTYNRFVMMWFTVVFGGRAPCTAHGMLSLQVPHSMRPIPAMMIYIRSINLCCLGPA